MRESPPSGDANEKADDEREDLPCEWMRRHETGGKYEDGTEKGTKGHEGGDKLGGTEKFCDPCEGPVVPVEAGEGQQQPVGADGEDGDEQGVAGCGGAEQHPSIIRDCEGGDVLVGFAGFSANSVYSFTRIVAKDFLMVSACFALSLLGISSLGVL